MRHVGLAAQRGLTCRTTGHATACRLPPGQCGDIQRMTDDRDKWAAGSAYEGYMGRWSRRLAPRFVSWLGIPRGFHWLDVGCGTGALASAISSHGDPASVVACDPSEPFIEFARASSEGARVTFVAAGTGSLPRRPGGYGSVTSLLALNFFPDPGAAIREMRSLSACQGTVSACVWDYAAGVEFLRQFWDAAAEVDSTAADLDEGNRFPLCRRHALIDLFVGGGLRDVRCEPIEIPTAFVNFDDYWGPLLGGTGPAPAYVTSLDDDRRASLARKLEETLRPKPDGTISLAARAWAIRGTVT